MAYTEDRERQQNRRNYQQRTASETSRRSLLEDGANMAAVALGSAAILHRSGSMAKVARNIDRSYKFLKNTSKIASDKLGSRQHITYQDLKAFNKEVKSSWRAIAKESKDKPIVLRADNPDTMFSLLHAMKATRGNQKAIGSEIYRSNYLVAPAKDKFMREFDNGDINRQRKFMRFINSVAERPHSKEVIATAMKRSNFNEAEKNFAEQIVDTMIANATQEHKDDAEKLAKLAVNGAQKILYDINTLEKHYGGGTSKLDSAIEKLYGDQAATIEDILKNKDKIRKSSFSTGYDNDGVLVAEDTMELLEKLHERYKKQGEEFEQRFLKLRPDRFALRKSANGDVYSFNAPSELKHDTLALSALTIPGKILKLRDLEQVRKAPVMDFIMTATQDPSLAAIVNKKHPDGHKNTSVDGNYVRVLDTVYEITRDGLEARADNIRAVSSRFGWAQRMQHQLAGDTGYKKSSNKILNWLDIGQDRDHFSGSLTDTFLSRLKKFGDKEWRQNVFDRFLNPSLEDLAEFSNASMTNDIDYAVDYIERAKRVQKFWKENTYEIANSAIAQIGNQLDDQSEAKKIYQKLGVATGEELLEYLLDRKKGGLLNEDLTHLLNRYIHNPTGARNALYLHTDKTHLSTSGGSIADLFGQDMGNSGVDFWQMLRIETAKEAMLTQAGEMGYSSTLSSIETALAGFSTQERRNARRTAHLAFFQDKTGINTELSEEQLLESDESAEVWNKVRRIENIMNTSRDSVDQSFRQEFKNMANENISVLETRDIDEDLYSPEHYGTFIHIKKSTGPMSLISGINNAIKQESLSPVTDAVSSFFKQFVAGRDNMENVTMATYTPYFLLSRLSDDLNHFGLGFSRDSMGSVGSLAMNALTKRILPIAIGATYAEWLDDTSQAVTGTSITGAAANGLANADLATRKSLDGLGITPWLNELKTVNPVMQYWGDKTSFMNFDERKEWYESGYEPMRKDPWWTFGGVQEARGSSIEYWAPSYARRINSDYKDKSLYDGYFDKWSHSLLPTPSNPFSPIAAVLDPYWLEDKHEDDRPYAVSSPMFSEGTPWGAVLNPTVGKIIKPEKELHDWRLHNGVDIKSALHALNENIKERAKDIGETHLIAIDGGDISPVTFTAFDAPTEDTKAMSVQYHNGTESFSKSATTYGVYDAGENILSGFHKFNDNKKAVNALTSDTDLSFKSLVGYALFSEQSYIPNGEIMQNTNDELGVYQNGDTPTTTKELMQQTGISASKKLEIESYVDENDDGTKKELARIVKPVSSVMSLIRGKNEAIKSSASGDSSASSFDESEGILTPDKLSHYQPSQGMALLSDPDTVQELIHAGKGADLVRDASTSARLISGIYGYMGSEAIGFGVYNDKRIARSGDMTSFTRAFWDSPIGGAGGETADIFRRFVPTFKRGVSPLMNDMPDWLPERYRYGDPYTATRDGEMRLPGKGYESLNELHPDQYGRYGAFDRFKILADIAPFSPEYKMWREIAKKTISDPVLKEEMADIRSRVSQQGRKHDFYNYNVVGKSLDYENVVVSEVLGYGKFRSGGTIYKLAGARVLGNENESQTDVLSRYLHEGMEVTVAKDSDESYQTNNDSDKTTNVAVYIDGVNLAEDMITQGDAVRKKNDTSTPAVLGRLSTTQKIIGYASEVFAHVDIPWLSDQFLRVRSPLESYQAEQVYGTSYQTWSHPIDTMLLPAFERAMHQDSYAKTAFRELFNYVQNEVDSAGRSKRHLAFIAHAFTDRGAFIGGALANLISPGSASFSLKAMQLGSSTATIGHFFTGGNSYLDEAVTGADIGVATARFFGKSKALGAAAGTMAGAVYRTLHKGIDTKEWIPERTRKNWALEDYFDRLTYIKYMGLYHEAAERAKDEEDVDVEDLVERREERNRKIQGRIKNLEKIKKALTGANGHVTSEGKENLKKYINKKLNVLNGDTTIIEGGKWTHTALIYKQAAESTMYAIDKNSSWSQIITALPTNDKEYFMEFVKERNPDKRQEILNTVSPALRKALSLSWGIEIPKEKNNLAFFKEHPLPAPNWIGWRPDIDLKDIEVKTIQNEALTLSDFGFYESQLQDPNVMHAPTVYRPTRDSAATVKSNLEKILQGKGLRNVNINVTDNSEVDTHRIVSDIAVYTGSRTLKRMVDNSMDNQL